MHLSLVYETLQDIYVTVLFFSSDTVYKCKADGEEFDQTEVVYSDHHKTLIQIGWKPSLRKVKPKHASASTFQRKDLKMRFFFYW